MNRNAGIARSKASPRTIPVEMYRKRSLLSCQIPLTSIASARGETTSALQPTTPLAVLTGDDATQERCGREGRGDRGEENAVALRRELAAQERDDLGAGRDDQDGAGASQSSERRRVRSTIGTRKYKLTATIHMVVIAVPCRQNGS